MSGCSLAVGAGGAAGDAGLPLALSAAALRGAVPPLRAARSRRLQGQLRVLHLPYPHTHIG